MLTHEDKFPLAEKISDIRQTTNTILDRLHKPRLAPTDDLTQALCTISHAILLLAEIQLETGVQP